ncbi:DeoR family transcriptional regulator [Rhizobium sp. Root274]|jgi:predicted DNA-binding transcriptional regulator YafY|uniref:helix-turn-helix transcriptional regulator n=1 Tax=unclassified Rhizobium TaxID=2613769 RepID=UPI00071535DA|nr:MULTISPECIES: WYL domain-containing protein [unclassified Rhizobium]KQW26409.1 DeoR family transcriptional regulator [Rhizobium sp. Root1240]KRD26379.1 DeoR family transcriptional regulator [Rhizobium sp. Root274]
MSFAKAQDLLRLARLAATRRTGVGLEEICDEFGVSHRTAQRMTDAMATIFANVETIDGPDRRRRWRVADPQLNRLQPRQDTVIEALEIAGRAARADGRVRHAAALEDLRDGLLARLTPKDALRTEADVEAVLLAMGSVTRPGPRVNLKPPVLDAVIEALRGPFRLQICYGTEDAFERIIEPHGLLLGHRSYLVARQPDRGDEMRNFRIDRILRAHTLDQSFNFAPGFSLQEYAAKSFGVYQDPKQYGEVIWRFDPRAAARAAEFCFHPDQVSELQEDGSLIVRFHAAGWLEMAWHLYQWGNTVEVLAPQGLRSLVEDHRRSDFPSLP